MSINWQLDADPPPAILTLPPGVASLDEAHAAIELWEHYSGKRLDATQRLVVEVMMAETVDGRWAAATTGREMPRQNGKGDEVEVVELWGLVQRAEAILHTVHDAVLLATQTQQRMLGVLESHVDLRRLVKRVWRGTGQQMIEMRNGGVIWYRTRTGSGGRGVDDIDRLVVDEAQHADDEQMASITPTLLANRNPQMNALGTAGIEGKSAWWWGVRRRALSPEPGAFGYVGHTAEQVSFDGGQVVQVDVDPTDRSLWRSANPAVSSGRGGGMAFLEEQFQRLGPVKFGREHLGIWDPESGAVRRIIPATSWSCCHDERSGPVGVVSFSLDVSPQRDTLAFGVAGASGVDGVHIEVVSHGPHPGAAAAVEEAKRLQDTHGGMLTLAPGPAASLHDDLIAAGVRVHQMSGSDYTEACGDFYDAVMDGEVRHLDQPELNAAVAGADRRWSGDAWYWARRSSVEDITPLVACTVARRAHLHVREPALSVW